MITILHTEASTGWGGQEIRIIRESLGMAERGYRLVIAAPVKSGIFKKAKEAGLEVIPADFQKKNPFSVMRMRALLSGLKPDIINTHSSSDSWVTTLAAKLCSKVPVIIRTRHLSIPISRSFLSRLLYDVLPDAVMTTGEDIRQKMINNNGFRGEKIISVPTGIDIKLYDPERVKPAFETDNFAVGMVSVLRSWKGHLYFLEAIPKILEKVKNVSFYIAGDGPMYDQIINRIKELSLEDDVTLLGYRDDVAEVMASLDIVVHPSYANEGVPQSILQASAMKKPVVGSDVGAIREALLDGRTGFLVEPKDSGYIAENVVTLCRDEELRNRFGQEGRRVVEENYTIEKMLDKIEALYRKFAINV